MLLTVISIVTLIVGFFTVKGLQARAPIQRYFVPQLSTFQQRSVFPQYVVTLLTSMPMYNGQLEVPTGRTGRILLTPEPQIFVRNQHHLSHGVSNRRSLKTYMKSSTTTQVDIVRTSTTDSTKVNIYNRNVANDTSESVIESPIAALRTVDAQQSVELLNNLEGKRTDIPSFQDENLVQIHLNNLKEMRETNNSSFAVQVKFIKDIENASIRNQVFKIFVKGILAKNNSVLNSSEQTMLDVNNTNVLIETISEILDKLKTNTSVANAVNDSINKTTLKTAVFASTIPTTEQNSLQTRIKNALLSYVKTSINSNVQTTTLPSESSRRQSPVVGLTISDASSIRNVTYSTMSFTELQNKQDSTTQFLPAKEPFGGVAVYWTHLSASLAEMLCSLCRQQNNVSCTRRHCNNDNVNWTSVTRSTV